MNINQEMVEKIRLVWTSLIEEDKIKIINVLKLLYNTIGKIENVIIKIQFETILSLIEEKILVNLEEKNSVINFKKINNIVNKNNIESVFTEKQINNLIQKINTLNTIIKKYFIKSITKDYQNIDIDSDGNIVLLFQNIIKELIELFIK